MKKRFERFTQRFSADDECFGKIRYENRRCKFDILKAGYAALGNLTESICGKSPLSPDFFDPFSGDMRKAFFPFTKGGMDVWRSCKWHPHSNPFGSKELDEAFEAETRSDDRALTQYLDSVDELCRAGEDRFPSVADRFEQIRQTAHQLYELVPSDWTVNVDLQGKGDRVIALCSEISVALIKVLMKEAKKHGSDGRAKGASKYCGQRIREISVGKDGQSFKVDKTTYKITSKKALEVLDKLLESYASFGSPPRLNVNIASYFNRGDALTFRKKYIKVDHGLVHLDLTLKD